MKRIVSVALLFLGLTAAAFASDIPSPRPVPRAKTVSASIHTAAPATAPHQVYLTDIYGQVVPVTVDADHPLIGAASWCPFCHYLVEFLNDPQIRPYLKGKQLNFVYADEWPRVESQIKAQLPALMTQNGFPSYQYDAIYANTLAKMKSDAHNGMVAQPTELDHLPGNHYFITEASKRQSPLKMRGFPMVYSPETGTFDSNAMNWVKANMHIPAELLTQKGYEYHLYK